jgi:hypothetical protein
MIVQITPSTGLPDWTLDWIKEILDTDRDEDAYLEFKSGLNSKDPKHT